MERLELMHQRPIVASYDEGMCPQEARPDLMRDVAKSTLSEFGKYLCQFFLPRVEINHPRVEPFSESLFCISKAVIKPTSISFLFDHLKSFRKANYFLNVSDIEKTYW